MKDIEQRNIEMLKTFQKAKQMSDLIYTNSDSSNANNSQDQPNPFDMEKMMKMFEIMNIINSDNNENEETKDIQNAASDQPRHTVDSDESIYASSTQYIPGYSTEQLESPAVKSIKAALPYIDFRHRKQLSIFIKLMEIQNLLEFYSNTMVDMTEVPNKDLQRGMLMAMKPYFDANKKDVINNFLKLMSIKDILESMSK